jgi:hypothetical protein
MKLRLGPLPKTEPVKVTVALTAALKDKLDRYAKLHSETWKEPVDAAMLIPHILEHFVNRDKAFKSAMRKDRRESEGNSQS